MGRPGSRVRGVSCSISICRSSFGVFNQRLFTRVAIAMGSLNRLLLPLPMANDKLENGKCLRLRYNARGVSASESEALPAFIFCGELMFERYTEKARRVIFFARYEASQFGAPAIEPEHLLLGLMREDKTLAGRFFPRAQITIESIRLFFSSRRRHTRLQGDWSSDVCSSDLEEETSTTYSNKAWFSGGSGENNAPGAPASFPGIDPSQPYSIDANGVIRSATMVANGDRKSVV